jgi:hypothetical protein
MENPKTYYWRDDDHVLRSTVRHDLTDTLDAMTDSDLQMRPGFDFSQLKNKGAQNVAKQPIEPPNTPTRGWLDDVETARQRCDRKGLQVGMLLTVFTVTCAVLIFVAGIALGFYVGGYGR